MGRYSLATRPGEPATGVSDPTFAVMRRRSLLLAAIGAVVVAALPAGHAYAETIPHYANGYRGGYR